ncbi:MAG: Ig-like domain-containing protein [Prolixibacteraceae bacterium]|nr:Ig-like domain-containing protein [Prolixibacteraceae bacterium]MBN2649911.1 Ig-like domain-containing protein [Prolixibacteraceae bacterium]
MKKTLLYILIILSVGIYTIGCTQFEEYKSVDVLKAPATTLSVSEVADSSFVLDIYTDKAGHLGYAISSDTASSVETISIISLSLDGAAGIVATEVFEYDEATSETITIGGLMPNSFYKVHVAATNTDGVESVVKTFIVKTDDGVGPTFVSSSPAISGDADVAINAPIVLTFDEPILVNPEKLFTLSYYYANMDTSFTLDATAVDGRTISVPQSQMAHPGDYFFLSWEAGALTDLSGNTCSERISGVIGGALKGNFYRLEYQNFDIGGLQVSPEPESVLAAHDFVIDVSFPFSISLEDLSSDMLMINYSNWLGVEEHQVSVANNCEIINDTTLRITQNHNANHGDYISLYIAEGVLSDNYGNLNAESDYAFGWQLGDFTVPTAISPEPGSIVANQMFNVEITFDFSISLNEENPGSVSMKYVNPDGNSNTHEVTVLGISTENDSILIVQTPQAVEFGSTVYLNIGEGVVIDSEGNVNLELQDVVYWEVPKLASSIDVLLGQYIVSGISYFDESTVTDTVSVELVEGKTDQVHITGLFKSLLGESEPVVGIYNAVTSQLSIAEQQIGTGDDRIYSVFSNATADGTIVTSVLEDGTMNTDLALGVYDGSWEWLGFFEYLPEVTWTKITEKSLNVHSSSKLFINNNIEIKRIPKNGIK